MKTKRIFGWPQLLALCGLFACHNAFAFYNPSTGRWLSRDPIEERDGPSVYAFVRNLPVSLMDNLGLCGNCGPDVTGPLVHTLTSIRDYFDGMSYQSQRDSCYALIDPRPVPGSPRGIRTFASAWIIPQLAYLGIGGPGMLSAFNYRFEGPARFGTPPPCDRSVVYNGNCHFSGSIHYLMFGHVTRLCHDAIKEHGGDPFWFTESAAKSYVLAWKLWLQGDKPSNYVGEALAFTTAGWNRLWAVSFKSPAADMRSCSVVPGNRATNRNFPFQWRPYQILPEWRGQ